jgi:acetyl esterase/lipase
MRMAFMILALATSACSGSSPAAPLQPVTEQSNPVTPARLMTWDDLLSRPRPTPTHTVHWGPGATDVADLWLPDGAGPHPAVVMVHGGCWQKEVADRTIMAWAADDLRRQGIAVWNIEYRGVDEAGGGYPGTFLDVAHAADALRDQAAAHALDLTRVAAFGHSAGGHLAMWLAARPRLPQASPMRMDNPLKLVGVFNSGGLADLAESKDVTGRSCLADIYDKLVGQISSSRARVLSDTSPPEMFPLGVRQISVNGHDDTIAPPVLGESIARKARAAGDRAEAQVVMSEGHAELIAPGTKAWGVEVAALREMLGLK